MAGPAFRRALRIGKLLLAGAGLVIAGLIMLVMLVLTFAGH